LTAQLPRQCSIESVQNSLRIAGAGLDGLHGYLDHRCDQGSWHAVSRDIRNQEANPVLVDGNEVVEIAGDGVMG